MFSVTKKSPLPFVLAAAVCFFTACNSHKEVQPERAAYEIPPSVLKKITIDTVDVCNITNSIKFNGIVDYNTNKVENIYPLVSGTIEDITVGPGDYVQQGQVLGVIKSSEIANYNAALINTETNVALAERQLHRQEDMYASGLASQLDVTTAKVSYEQAVAAKTAAEKILSINGGNRQGMFYVKSPVSGFIVQKNVTNGMAIRTDNGTNLFTIADLKDVWVQANVYESSIQDVHEGDEVVVTTLTYPDREYIGRVNKVMNTLDPTNRVMKMRVVLPNPDYSLKPQMFATITVKNSLNQRAMAIPSNALIFDHSQYYVVSYNGPKDVKIRPVELISNNGKTAYIKSGVSEGDLIIGTQALLIYSALNN